MGGLCGDLGHLPSVKIRGRTQSSNQNINIKKQLVKEKKRGGGQSNQIVGIGPESKSSCCGELFSLSHIGVVGESELHFAGVIPSPKDKRYNNTKDYIPFNWLMICLEYLPEWTNV